MAAGEGGIKKCFSSQLMSEKNFLKDSEFPAGIQRHKEQLVSPIVTF